MYLSTTESVPCVRVINDKSVFIKLYLSFDEILETQKYVEININQMLQQNISSNLDTVSNLILLTHMFYLHISSNELRLEV